MRLRQIRENLVSINDDNRAVPNIHGLSPGTPVVLPGVERSPKKCDYIVRPRTPHLRDAASVDLAALVIREVEGHITELADVWGPGPYPHLLVDDHLIILFWAGVKGKRRPTVLDW